MPSIFIISLCGELKARSLNWARRKAIELGAIKAGLIRPQAEPSRNDDDRISIAAAIDSYLDLVKHHRSLRTYRRIATA